MGEIRIAKKKKRLKKEKGKYNHLPTKCKWWFTLTMLQVMQLYKRAPYLCPSGCVITMSISPQDDFPRL